MNKKVSTTLKLGFGVGILIFLISKVGIGEAVDVLSKSNPLLLLYSFPLYLIFFFLNAVGVQILSNVYVKIPFKRIFKYNLYSWTIGHILPSKLGELSIIYFLRKEEIAVADGMVISVVDKAVSLFLFAIVSFVGIFLIFPLSLALKLFGVLSVLSIIFLLLSFLALKGKLMRVIPRKIRPYFDDFRSGLIYFITKKRKEIFRNFIMTCLKWIFATLFFYIIFIALGVRVDFLSVIIIYMVVALICLIPISINGLGVRQVVGVTLFSAVGISAAQSLNMYLVTLTINYSIAALIFLYMMKEGIKVGS